MPNFGTTNRSAPVFKTFKKYYTHVCDATGL